MVVIYWVAIIVCCLVGVKMAVAAVTSLVCAPFALFGGRTFFRDVDEPRWFAVLLVFAGALAAGLSYVCFYLVTVLYAAT